MLINKLYTTATIILLPLFVFAQKGETYFTVHYPNGKLKYEGYKKGKDTINYWKGYIYEASDTLTYLNKFDSKGTKLYEGWLTNNQRDKFWLYYNSDRTIAKKGTYKNNRKNGTWYYYTGTHCDSLGEYIDDKKTGTWKYFPRNSSLHQSIYYSEKQPYYSSWFMGNYSVIKEGYLLNSQKTGFWKFYYENSTHLRKTGNFKKNKKDGYWKFYTPDGKMESEGRYKNGTKNGYWHFYDNDGVIREEGNYTKGKRNDWWSFFMSGKLTHKCQLKNNEKDGFCINYKNGKLTKASKYEKGKKLKEWTDYASFRKDNSGISFFK